MVLCPAEPPHFRFRRKGTGIFAVVLDERYRAALNFCGSQSGRDPDKGRRPAYPSGGNPCTSGSEAVLVCRKIYAQDIDPKLFVDGSIERNYNGSDYHRVFTGEIVKCLASGD
jgi:flavin reductase (DIM6/NTAB) family NADH-FMN oxidoreductase RutF